MATKDNLVLKDDPSLRPIGQRIQGAVVALSLAIGFGLGVGAIQTPDGMKRLNATLDFGAFMEGRTAAAMNYALAHNLPVDGFFRAAGGVFRWRLFHSGGPQVWAGDNDWLYLIDELRPFEHADANMAARADTLAKVAAKLKAQGIDLVVAVLPDKARLLPEYQTGPRSQQADARLPAWLDLLAKRGLKVVDVNATYLTQKDRAALWWRTDTHWSQAGSALAAKTIAAKVTTKIDRGHVFTTTHDAAETDGPGDLLRLMSLDQISDDLPIKLRPVIDRQHLAHTVEAKSAADAGGLLDDGPKVEVTLVGSSYSVNANFAGHLQQELNAPVLNVAEAGGGFAKAAQKYFNGATFKETKPAVVVWEIPERVVGQPLVEDDKLLAAWAAK
jgi:alginate O-acetyltransferase complex protein AlgJ